jgi:hypothetical protein
VILLDTTAVLALADGHEALHRLVDNVARTPRDWLVIPALALMQAETADAASAVGALALPGVRVEPLGQIGACVVGGMVRNGFGGPDVCHTLYAAEPRPEALGESIILTGREEDYPPGYLTVDINSPGMLGFH